MSLRRLQRILNQTLTIKIDSSQATVDRIQLQVAARRTSLLAKNKPVPPSKVPTAVPSLQTVEDLLVRPIDLLRKIGDLTTPANANMARLSASWATRRYFWAIAESTTRNRRFRLSDDARDMDFHQKTLLSDEFGIGFGGLVLEKLFDAGSNIDISFALRSADQFQNITQAGSAQPDYLFWSHDPQHPYYVVECKGCQTQRAAVTNQLRRGMEQVPSISFATGPRHAVTLVVGTHLQKSQTITYVIDPPPGPEPEESSGSDRRGLERAGKNSWKILEPEAFSEWIDTLKRAKMLNWAGRHRSSAIVLATIAGGNVEGVGATDRELSSLSINGVPYRGATTPLYPELGVANLRIFAGVQEDILAAAGNGGKPSLPEAAHQVTPDEADPSVSVGEDGTCLVIQGLFDQG